MLDGPLINASFQLNLVDSLPVCRRVACFRYAETMMGLYYVKIVNVNGRYWLQFSKMLQGLSVIMRKKGSDLYHANKYQFRRMPLNVFQCKALFAQNRR